MTNEELYEQIKTMIEKFATFLVDEINKAVSGEESDVGTLEL